MSLSEQHLKQYLERFGYQSLEVPTLEPASLFLTKAGDQIIERLVTFEHQGSLFALRPEFTASAAYRYLSEDRHDVVRWQFSGPIFENIVQPSQRSTDSTGYPYQHHSIGVELIGFPGALADAEIVALAILSLIEQGLTDFSLTLGHVGLTRHLLRQFDLDDRALRFLLKQRADLYEEQATRDQVIAKLDQYLVTDARQTGDELRTAELPEKAASMTTEMLSAVLSNSSRSQTLGGRTQHDIARRLLEKEQRAASRTQIIAALDFLIDWMAIRGSVEATAQTIQYHLREDDQIAQTMLGEWLQIIDLLEHYGIDRSRIELEPDLVRSWDYYNGMVFELRSADGKSLAGGGRYDDLAQLLGAPSPIPAVGFVYDVEGIHQALGDPASAAQGMVMTGSSAAVVDWSTALRAGGVVVSVLPDVTLDTQDVIHVNEADQAEYRGQYYMLADVERLVEQLHLSQHNVGTA